MLEPSLLREFGYHCSVFSDAVVSGALLTYEHVLFTEISSVRAFTMFGSALLIKAGTVAS
jgi:hypothetical protein